MLRIHQSADNENTRFENVFRQYYQPLWHLSQYYLGDKDEAREVVQDAFMKLWEIRYDIEPDSNLKNFLFTLVKNNCLNILKHNQIKLKHHEKIQWIEMYYQYESLAGMNEDYLEINELRDKIELAIQHLPEHSRAVFEMSRFGNMKNQEISEKLGITVKTVEAHMTKALKILRQELKDYLPFILLFIDL
jgi:RNA polymerase sigma-70 factor, ECF subfamily